MGPDGSRQMIASHSGQCPGTPSGVREAMVMTPSNRRGSPRRAQRTRRKRQNQTQKRLLDRAIDVSPSCPRSQAEPGNEGRGQEVSGAGKEFFLLLSFFCLFLCV